MDDTKNILLVGVGGQGTLLASKLLTYGLMQAGYDVKMSEIHGMSQRGGDVSAHIRYGKKVHSSVIEKGSGDLLISFEQMEAYRWVPFMREDGTVIVNNQAIHPVAVLSGKANYHEDIIGELSKKINTKVLDARKEAEDLGNPRGTNMVLVGAAVKLLNLLNIDWKKAIAANVKPQFVEPNMKTFERGLSLV
ncbi:MAG: indolepyruvate oxidoreductase subunit beta [Defluviitaleaceae bacterium]|nr:indolepyruvate oxidoreductase subunit beta [Defluviitaleaceae bacterium]